MDERALRIEWALCPGLEASTYRKLFYHFGSASALQQATEADWLSAVRLRPQTLLQMRKWQASASGQTGALEERLLASGIICIVQGDVEYPQALLNLYDPPIVLFARGKPGLLQTEKRVAVVGTRRASSYGLEVTRWLAARLVQAGVTVCSGMALGIDACAHMSVIENGGDTIAVLGCGVDICYPPGNRALYAKLQQVGLLISEYPPQSLAAKHRFPERNRLIAALGGATVVVQAGEKSGALRTVESAMDLGRDVYVVPGPITSKSFRGAHGLLLDGAIPLIDPDEFVRNCFSNGDQPSIEKNQSIPTHLTELADLLLEDGPLRAGELVQRTMSAPGHIYAALLELEMGGMAKRLPDGRYQWVAGRGSG